MSLISASKLFDELRRSEAFSLPPLLTEGDSSKSIMPIEDQTKQIAKVENLSQYQEPSLAKLDVLTPDTECLIMVHRVSAAYIKEVLKKWTRLREIEERLDHTEREIDARRKQDQSERRKSQQPTVESDDSDDQLGALPGIKQSNPRFAAPTPRRAPSAGPLFPDSPTMPIPVPKTFGPTAPLSPASSSQYGVSPRSSGVFSSSPQQSPRSSLSSLPTRAAAAVKMHNEDESVDLEIPWRLCLRTQYWEYIDGKVERTNSEYPSSKALNDRNTSTEIMASWVCREAIEEVGYKYETLKKERNDGRRTKLETCFSISRPLTFVSPHSSLFQLPYSNTDAPSPKSNASSNALSRSTARASVRASAPPPQSGATPTTARQPITRHPSTRTTTALPATHHTLPRWSAPRPPSPSRPLNPPSPAQPPSPARTQPSRTPPPPPPTPTLPTPQHRKRPPFPRRLRSSAPPSSADGPARRARTRAPPAPRRRRMRTPPPTRAAASRGAVAAEGGRAPATATRRRVGGGAAARLGRWRRWGAWRCCWMGCFRGSDFFFGAGGRGNVGGLNCWEWGLRFGFD